MSNVTTCGIYLAKNVFSLHAVDGRGVVVLRKSVSRARLAAVVAPYRKSGKNDGNDAAAICEAVSRPSMRFVPVKSVEQQAVLTLQRYPPGPAREHWLRWLRGKCFD